MSDLLSFHDLLQEGANKYFKCSPFFIIEWLIIPPPPPLIGEQYGNVEQKYPEGGYWQNLLHPQGSLRSPLFLINSLETAGPFNMVSHPWDTACYLDRITRFGLGLKLGLSSQCWNFSKFIGSSSWQCYIREGVHGQLKTEVPEL